jgi:HEAT repeat protein
LDPGHVLALLDGILVSPDANVRRFAIEALVLRPTAEHVTILGDILSDPHPALRGRARTALEGLAVKAEWKDAVIREGIRVLGGKDWRGLEQASLVLGHLDHKPAAGRLVELLRHQRPEVFVTAAWGLRQLAVPDTLPATLTYYESEYKAMFAPALGGGRPPADVDLQLSQLGQFFGRAKYEPADGLLRRLVPQATATTNPAGQEARAAAVWALGLLHEGKAPPDLVGPLVSRLTAVRPFDIEGPPVRRMAAIALGRMKAADALVTLREFAPAMKPSLDPVNNACCWAIGQMTGEKISQGVIEVTARDWFLSPVD